MNTGGMSAAGTGGMSAAGTGGGAAGTGATNGTGALGGMSSGGTSSGGMSSGGTSSGGTSSGGMSSGGTSSGGMSSGGTSSGGTSSGGTSSGGQGSGGEPSSSVTLRVMSLNVYGHKTMPGAAPTYAALIEDQNIDIVGVQEGVQDWQLETEMPTDYSRAEALGAALGGCWERQYQVFINTCRGNSFDSFQRFDLTDGPNATRTGEEATVTKEGVTYSFINIHWDHEDAGARAANSSETAARANAQGGLPVVVLGDFNEGCGGGNPEAMRSSASLSLIQNGGIDCIFSKEAPGSGYEVDASPSDHDAVVAELTL